MSKNSLEKIKKKAERYFFKGEYEKAMQKYSLALMQSPNDKEVQIGAILTDMAHENEEKAQAIYEYYQITKEFEDEPEEIIESLINSIDIDIDMLNQFISSDDAVFKDYEEDNSINYQDFLDHIEKTGDFRTAYQDIMFSTKVLINNKDDFFDFLEKLVDNNYIDVALNYIETAVKIFPKDLKLKKIFNKVKNSDYKI